jgi:hypothetical protein
LITQRKETEERPLLQTGFLLTANTFRGILEMVPRGSRNSEPNGAKRAWNDDPKRLFSPIAATGSERLTDVSRGKPIGPQPVERFDPEGESLEGSGDGPAGQYGVKEARQRVENKDQPLDKGGWEFKASGRGEIYTER